MKTICIIPARYASTRFPGKVLTMIDGNTMLQRVYDRAKVAIEDVVIATDNDEYYELIPEITKFTKKYVLGGYHFCGTNRCAEAVDIIEGIYKDKQYDIVINLQADMPYIKPEQIIQLISVFVFDPMIDIATLIVKVTGYGYDSNDVKVVIDKTNEALYFSRSSIPFDNMIQNKHIGIYAFRRSILKHIASLPNDAIEGLEQNAWLYHGWKIKCVETPFDVISINVPEDLKKL